MNFKTLLGAALICLAVCLAAGGFYVAHSVKRIKFDAQTLCPIEGVNAATVIIVDKTDPLTASEQSRIRDIVEKARDAAKRGDRVTVKMIQQGDDGAIVLGTVIDLCNPGAEANPLFENPKRVAARYQNAFLEPFSAALASLPGEGSAQASPIARSIASALSELGMRPEGDITLILISDLMEHGPEASAYNGTLTESALRKLLTPAMPEQLKGVEVRILLLPRPRYTAQQQAAVTAWRRFFKAASGRDPDIRRP